MFERKEPFQWKIPILILTGILVLSGGIYIGVKTRKVEEKPAFNNETINEKNEETGSNTDSGNNHESTGVIEEIVTDAATGVKDAVTEAGTILEDAGRGVEDLFSGNAEEQMTDSTLEQTMPR